MIVQFGKDWSSWLMYTITLLLVVTCAGVFVLSAQKALTEAVKETAKDQRNATYTQELYVAKAYCSVGEGHWLYSTNREESDVKNLDVSEIRVWSSGYVVVEFSDGSIVAHSKNNCVITATPKYRV
jgi:hypothetical protein